MLGVIGLGSVGKAVFHTLGYYYKVVGYDIKGDYNWEDILQTECIFICVNTPEGDVGRLDCSNVENILIKLQNDNYNGIVIIKSTLRVGFMEKALKDFPRLKLVYMPEFLREKSSFQWFVCPDRIVVAAFKDELADKALSYFWWVDNAKILKMDFKSAEIAKLAHNAFIATKVSFTNEMEQITKELNGDIESVMQTIWADRRVKSNEHLKPNLGPYGGKCVPKDTRELINAVKKYNPILLKAVERVNGHMKRIYNYKKIYTVIPTINRPKKLMRAIDSLLNQKRIPDKIFIIYEKDGKNATEVEDLIEHVKAKIDNKDLIKLIPNKRTHSLSGAINTAIDEIKKEITTDPKQIYLSILDDDDEHLPEYLEECYKCVQKSNNITAVFAPIIWNGKDFQEIHCIDKVRLTPRDFFLGNPGVQGSNMFIRFDIFSQVGFDENLLSTTDRDFMIRFLNIISSKNLDFIVLDKPLVFYHGEDDDRLTVNIVKKTQGLNVFYRKYKDQFSPEDFQKSLERARRLFSYEYEP
ncbi:MAG: glycosyltransferase [Promethearchaeota archaeon]